MTLDFGKSIKNDYILFCSLAFSVVFMGALLLAVFGPAAIRLSYINLEPVLRRQFARLGKVDAVGGLICFLFLVAGLVCFIKRFFYLKSFENNYSSVEAAVAYIESYGDRFGIGLEFVFNGKNCKKHFALMRNRHTRNFEEEETLLIAVKDGNPKKALIQSLYFEL